MYRELGTRNCPYFCQLNSRTGEGFEIRSMLGIAEAIVASVLLRKKQGFVFRQDYPLTDNISGWSG